MLGLKCTVPSGQLGDACLAEGLLTVGAGDNVLRLLPPLNISDDDVNEALEKLERAAASLATAGG
jgi:acetylornithine/N-succinyldiaminopimelate aminotransferase